MPITSAEGLPAPTPGDATAVPADMQALTAALGPKIIPNFASESARNTAIPIPATGRAAGVGSKLSVKHADRWGPILTDRTGPPVLSASASPTGVIPAGGGSDFNIGSFSQAAGVRLQCWLTVVVTRHTFDGGAVPTLRASLAVGVSGASWASATGEMIRQQGAVTYGYQTTLSGLFFIPEPGSTITRSLRASVWVDGGAGTGSRVDIVRADVSPCYVVASF